MEIFSFSLKFPWFVSLAFNWQYVCTGSGNGLAPNRRHALTRTNDDPAPWHRHTCVTGYTNAWFFCFAMRHWSQSPVDANHSSMQVEKYGQRFLAPVFSPKYTTSETDISMLNPNITSGTHAAATAIFQCAAGTRSSFSGNIYTTL